jgi:hypothetical protein
MPYSGIDQSFSDMDSRALAGLVILDHYDFRPQENITKMCPACRVDRSMALRDTDPDSASPNSGTIHQK